jgi:hypothetical protein
LRELRELKEQLDDGKLPSILAGFVDMSGFKQNRQLLLILVFFIKSIVHFYLFLFVDIGTIWAVSCSCAVYQLSSDMKEFILQQLETEEDNHGQAIRDVCSFISLNLYPYYD